MSHQKSLLNAVNLMGAITMQCPVKRPRMNGHLFKLHMNKMHGNEEEIFKHE